MENIPTKVTGDSLTADEWNNVPDELENAITETGIALTGADLSQLSKSISNYVAGGSFYIDSGNSSAYVLTPIGSKQGPTAYFNGLSVSFVPGNTNTIDAPTLNVDSLGVKTITTPAGDPLEIGDISEDNVANLFFDSVADTFVVGNVFAIRGAKTFGNTTLAVADTALGLGQIVETKGYTTDNDGGQARYIVVANATGTPDGGSYFDTAGGLQLELMSRDEGIVGEVFGIGVGAADDDVAFQNALNFTAANDLKLFMNKTYALTANADLPANSYLTGVGTLNMTINANTPALTFVGDNSVIENLTINGIGTGNSDSSTGTIDMDTTATLSGLRIRGVTLTTDAASSTGIGLNTTGGLSNTRIERNDIVLSSNVSGTIGIFIKSNTANSDVIISDNDVSVPVAANPKHAIRVINADQCQILNNRCAGGDDACLSVVNSVEVAITANVIRDTGASSIGIQITQSDSQPGVNGPANTSITGNIVLGHNVGVTVGRAGTGFEPTNITVVGNSITDCVSNCVLMNAIASSIVGNTFNCTGTDPDAAVTIATDATFIPRDITVSANSFNGPARGIITGAAGGRQTISDNAISVSGNGIVITANSSGLYLISNNNINTGADAIIDEAHTSNRSVSIKGNFVSDDIVVTENTTRVTVGGNDGTSGVTFNTQANNHVYNNFNL